MSTARTTGDRIDMTNQQTSQAAKLSRRKALAAFRHNEKRVLTAPHGLKQQRLAEAKAARTEALQALKASKARAV